MDILTIFVALIIACIPAIVWLTFFLKEDANPEPRRLLIYIFSSGVFISAIVLLLQFILQNSAFVSQKNGLIALVSFAFIEELFKFIATYASVRKDASFDEPVDAMIYMVVAALGFATVENIFVFANFFLDIYSVISVSEIFELAVIRFIGASLLHTLASALVGYYWAKGHISKKNIIFIPIGIITATLIHTAFNRLIVIFQNQNLLIYPSLFLIAVALIVLIEFEKLRSMKIPFSQK